MKKKHIYKITNIINNKSYIGQSTDYLRRFEEHKRKAHKEKTKLARAIVKYGAENFAIESLGEYENYCEMEIYFIEFYDTFKNGYNSTKGGEEPPRTEFLHYPKSIFIMVSDLLYWTSFAEEEIAKMCNVKMNYIDDCRTGRNHKIEKYNYPLRVKDRDFDEELVALIKRDLKETNLSQKELSKKYGISRSSITMINIGDHHHDENEVYPLRRGTKTLSKRPTQAKIEEVAIDLLTSDLTINALKVKHGLTRTMLDNINYGRREWSRLEGYDYPIRKQK